LEIIFPCTNSTLVPSISSWQPWLGKGRLRSITVEGAEQKGRQRPESMLHVLVCLDGWMEHSNTPVSSGMLLTLHYHLDTVKRNLSCTGRKRFADISTKGSW
jgi:hypothetical protein